MFKMEPQEVRLYPKVWGAEIWMANTEKYCGKRLKLMKGWRCSLHYHKKKDETFYVESGKVLMNVGDYEGVFETGNIVRIKPKVKHRFSGLENSVIIEISTHHDENDSYREEGELSGEIPEEIKQKYDFVEDRKDGED